MLRETTILLLLIRLCFGHPLATRRMLVQKRATPLTYNPFAAVVFTIAVVLCLALIMWAMRKHYQQKYVGDANALGQNSKEIPEVSQRIQGIRIGADFFRSS
jgi:hypothetical protein